MSTNYVVATYNGKCNRCYAYPAPENTLKVHLNKMLSLNHQLAQITIMKAKSVNYYKTYYDINKIKEKFDIPIIEIECENYGYSAGQWLKAFELTKDNFDNFIFIEDDYCPNMNNFDILLSDIYKLKFSKYDNIGLLCSLVEGSVDYYKHKKVYPIHFEGMIFINKKTLDKLYSCSKWDGQPRKWLDLIDNNIDSGYNWEKIRNSYLGGYYQLSFSHLFTLSGITHYDYVGDVYENNTLFFPYWNDNPKLKNGGEIFFYEKGDNIQKKYCVKDIINSPIVPIQIYNTNSIKKNTYLLKNIPKIIFIIGMHRCGSSLLSQCLINNNFSIGKTKNKDKDWQNPNGYFENDSFTKIHGKLLKYNDSQWHTINTNNMKYAQEHIDEYKELLKNEFCNEQLILIKDPRLTFFVDFLKKVCEHEYDPYFLFLTRDEKECTDSICKAQNITNEVASKLINDTNNKYEDTFLKINHNDIINNNDVVMENVLKHCDSELITNTTNLVNMNLYRNRNKD